MASLLAATGAVAATTLALRFSLRSAAKNGARLSPWMQALAGTHGGKEDWVKGGFLAKMTPEEASQILGLRCVPPSSSTCRDGDDPGGNPLRGPARPAGLRCNHAAPHSEHALTRPATGRESHMTLNRLKDAHRRIMLACVKASLAATTASILC